jgi:hypothetical protein
MKALTGIDASFLYLETANMPMHVGGVAVYDNSLTFDAFCGTLATRLPLIPKIPLYLAGARLFVNMGMAPITDGLGLIITVFSYNGLISISPMACPHLMPDLDQFTRYLWESANELETAVAAKTAKNVEKSVQQCQAITKAGTQCRNSPQNGYQYCHVHLSAAKDKMKA